MIYLLDTDVCVSYLRGKNSAIIEARLILVTHNTAEFSRVPGLQYKDWQTA